MQDDRKTTANTYQHPVLPSRGRWLWRQEFYSIHSHSRCKEAVNGVCSHGQWTNVHMQRVSSFVFRHAPGLWRWWANRRWLNPQRRFLEKMFPNLRAKP